MLQKRTSPTRFIAQAVWRHGLVNVQSLQLIDGTFKESAKPNEEERPKKGKNVSMQAYIRKYVHTYIHTVHTAQPTRRIRIQTALEPRPARARARRPATA